ncbi:MAG: tetratricopeptide repeat protein [Cyclobacteriaceae bacterium]
MRISLAILFFSILLIPDSFAMPQDQPRLDSLLLQLQNAPTDTVKINTLLEISSYYSAYNLALAVEYARKATELSNKQKLETMSAKANRALGLAYFNVGDYKNASSHFFQALRYYEAAKDTAGIMAIHNNLGVVHDRLKDFDQALQYYFKVQDLYNKVKSKEGYPFPLPSLYNNIANIYQTKGDIKSALQYYEKSLALAEGAGNTRVQGVALNNIGKLYFFDFKQPEKALDFLLRGLKVREENGDKGEIAKSLVFLGGYYHHQGNFEEGKRYTDRAVLLGKEIGSLEVQLGAYSSLSEIEEGLKHYKESLDAFKNFKRINDSIQRQSTASEITRLQLQYDFEKADTVQKQEQQQTRDRYIITIIILTACLLVALLVVILIRAKARQTELKRKNLLQDVEIKNKELTTNVMYLIRKNELINSVAERLMGVQGNIPSENHKVFHDIIIDLQKEADNDTWKEFELRFNQVHSDFYTKLRKLYPGLSPADEKLCAFLRLNMSSKEIAAITQQSIKSVEVARARLRKKLNLTNTTSNLVTHLSTL